MCCVSVDRYIWQVGASSSYSAPVSTNIVDACRDILGILRRSHTMMPSLAPEATTAATASWRPGTCTTSATRPASCTRRWRRPEPWIGGEVTEIRIGCVRGVSSSPMDNSPKSTEKMSVSDTRICTAQSGAETSSPESGDMSACTAQSGAEATCPETGEEVQGYSIGQTGAPPMACLGGKVEAPADDEPVPGTQT